MEWLHFLHRSGSEICPPLSSLEFDSSVLPPSQRPVPGQVGSPDLERTTKWQTGCRPSCASSHPWCFWP